MTRDEIAQMARKTGFTIHTDDSIYMEMLHSFAALVAAAEREACATIDVTPLNILASDGPGTAILKYRAAIRARSLA